MYQNFYFIKSKHAVSFLCTMFFLINVCNASETGVSEKEFFVDSSENLCVKNSWKMKGADLDHSGEASYRKKWTPTLEHISACFKKTRTNRTCIRVQGQYDDVKFPANVVATFGSQEAAQRARAKARSAMVVSKLQEFKVHPESILEIAPLPTVTYRGVSVEFVNDCLSLTTNESVNVSNEIDTSKLASVVAAKVDTDAIADAVVQKLVKKHTIKNTKSDTVSFNKFFLGTGVYSTFVMVDSDDRSEKDFLYMPKIGAGWHSKFLYGKLSSGFGMGHSGHYRYAADVDIHFGYYRNPLLQFGVTSGMRYAWSKEMKSYLQRSWYIGIEGTHCFNIQSNLKVCAYEMIAPLGNATSRLEYDNGNLYKINERDDSLIRFDIGATVRYNIY